jgi:hypothetical protein
MGAWLADWIAWSCQPPPGSSPPTQNCTECPNHLSTLSYYMNSACNQGPAGDYAPCTGECDEAAACHAACERYTDGDPAKGGCKDDCLNTYSCGLPGW